MHQIYKSKIKRDIFFYLHRIILNRCNKIFCWTDAALNNIHTIYGIDKSKLFKVPAPFLINELSISPRKTPNKPRVLFIGGDWLRKGGDVLLNNWENRLKQKCELTILTSNKFLKKEGVNVFTDIRYGTPDHKEIFKQNDILILPARFDAYPQVIGEAAAGGLAVIATQYALGSPEVIVHGRTGYIAQNPEESIEYLIKLLENIDLIDDFKKEGYKHMQSKFGIEEIKHKYFKAIAE
jgi:glycosyltransferase involved in cell wall biosynthesis